MNSTSAYRGSIRDGEKFEINLRFSAARRNTVTNGAALALNSRISMYGLVNKAVEGLITAQFGAAKWQEVARRAKVPRCPFATMQQYDDQLTYQMVGAASEVLQLSATQVLEAFGEHWVLFTAAQGYGQLLDHCGLTLRAFLLNLDSLHTRVGLIFPELQPPAFQSIEQPDGAIRLEYYSSRSGLAPMVAGLLRGLAKRFKTEISLEQLPADPLAAWQGAFIIHLRG